MPYDVVPYVAVRRACSALGPLRATGSQQLRPLVGRERLDRRGQRGRASAPAAWPRQPHRPAGAARRRGRRPPGRPSRARVRPAGPRRSSSVAHRSAAARPQALSLRWSDATTPAHHPEGAVRRAGRHRGRTGPGRDRPPRRRRLRGLGHRRRPSPRPGVEVTYCVITDGDAGGFDPAVPRSEIPGIRRAEQRAAAAVVGVNDVRFLGYDDGELVVSHDLRRDISRVIRQVRPQRILVQSPGAQLAAHPGLAPGPPGGGRGGDPGGLPGRPQPVRPHDAASRRGPRGVDGPRGVGHVRRQGRPLRRHHRTPST